MRATAYLQRQVLRSHRFLHEIADDLTPAELVTRVLPQTNLIAFDLWHITRLQDWVVQTLAQGKPELLDAPPWGHWRSLTTRSFGPGVGQEQADTLARSLRLTDLLSYADATHQACLEYLETLSDEALDGVPDVLTHLAREPFYLSDTMRREAPWVFEQSPLWRCFTPVVPHGTEHLAQMELLKDQLRLRPVETPPAN
jgi:hypothetical protein